MKLFGTITFHEDERYEQVPANAVLRPKDEIALDFDYGAPGERDRYNVVLKLVRQDYLKGEFIRKGDRVSGPVTCSLYRGANGIVLMGRWTEDGHTFSWFAQLASL
jgi:hypothetical protein